MVDINNELNQESKTESNNQPIPVEVRPHQVPHFKRVVDILSHEYGYLDVSTFGAGKTHITCAIAASFKLNMIVIGPKSTLNNWRKWTKIYGIHLIASMTYQSLRGQDCYELNHSLLERVDGEYRATDLFEQCVKSNVLLVFDEYHNLKNENTQLASAHALVKSLIRLVRMGYKARIALLSGTPCVEKESVTSTFKMLGIIQSDKLYNYNRSSKKYELVGIQEAIDKCNQYDPDETFAITCRSINKTTAKTICYDLYTRVLKRFIVSSMPPPPISSYKDVKNYYILMPPNDVERLKKGLLLFKSATNYRHEVQEVDLSGANWGDMSTSRQEIDSAKIYSVCRLASQNLIENKNCKVAIYCNYKRDMKSAASYLAKYNPLVMDGSSSEKQRSEIIKNFQADNDDYRVIISNPKVGGIGIDLDDKYGSRPRIMYILPSYFFTDEFQATGRIYREGTKSAATIRFIYSRAFPYETGILNSMANKSNVLRNMVTSDQNSIKFPGEYEELLELTPEEIATGTQQNLSQNDQDNQDTNQDIDQVKEEKEEKFYQTKKLVEGLEQLDRGPLDDDKYHSYMLFLEMIEKSKTKTENTEEKNIEDAVQTAIKLMNDNVSVRLDRNLRSVLFNTQLNEYKTEKDMIAFIEGFQM